MPCANSPSLKNGCSTWRRDSAHGFTGDGRSGATVWLSAVQTTSTRPSPSSGRTKRESVERLIAVSSHRVDREAFRVLLGLRRIEHDAVEQRLLPHVLARRLDAHLLRHLAEDVGPMHAIHEALVVGGLLHHPPTSELREPPHAVRLHRKVRLAVE